MRSGADHPQLKRLDYRPLGNTNGIFLTPNGSQGDRYRTHEYQRTVQQRQVSIFTISSGDVGSWSTTEYGTEEHASERLRYKPMMRSYQLKVPGYHPQTGNWPDLDSVLRDDQSSSI